MTVTTQLIPAIDLKDGQCVRLKQGRFDSTQVYGDDPLGMARNYVDAGATLLHLVDLDAAEGKGLNNTALIKQMASTLDVTLQVGGGIRTETQLEDLFDAGANRAVIGSLAIKDAARVKQWMARFGAHRIVLAFDVHSAANPVVHIHGWQDATDVWLADALTDYRPHGLEHVLCTDISRDGMSRGPSIELYTDVMTCFPEIKLQASGGVRDASDLRALSKGGVPYAISGRALLEGTLKVEEAIA
ncbi:MAG: 1-(5-phosphoribosyl)-5-[(5-phosphoribosylamino)methylideneamino]imidazole-4-carboxamide isomerase [Pseudomonadota bacterium]